MEVSVVLCRHNIGKYTCGSTDFWCHLLFVGIAPPTRSPLDPEKSNKALGFPALIIRPLLIGLSSRSTTSLGRRRARHHSSPAVINRRIATTSRVHLNSSTKAGALPTTHCRPAGDQPLGQVRAGTGPMIDKSSSCVRIKTLKKRY